jgi:hypothetical protein
LWLATSFLGAEGFFSLLSLFFFPWCFLLWVFSALLVLSDASSFFCFLARFMLLGSFFTWVYFLLEPFFFFGFPHMHKASTENTAS